MAKELERCVCGDEPEIQTTESDGAQVYLVCCNSELLPCWEGPWCKTLDEAIQKWNRVMRKVESSPATDQGE